MNRRVLAVMVAFAFAPAAHALRVPPGGGCPPNALCEAARQLVTIPAFFETTTQTDPSQPRDWVRIQNAGHWVKIVVAGDTFHLKVGADLLNAQGQFSSNIQAGQNTDPAADQTILWEDATIPHARLAGPARTRSALRLRGRLLPVAHLAPWIANTMDPSASRPPTNVPEETG